jgi:hypothetical protein
MTSRYLFASMLLLGACGAGSKLFTTVNATPAAGPAEAIACARTKLTQLGYQPVAYDEMGHRYVARKIDDSKSRPDPQFRRMVDRVEVEAAPGAAGKTDLEVLGHTLAEYETHRGPTEVEEKASNDVSGAAQAVATTCGQP